MSLAPYLEPGQPTRAVQIALIRQSYDCGGPDGIPGPKTWAAIARWAADHSVSAMEAPSLLLSWREVPRPDRMIIGGTSQLPPVAAWSNWHDGRVKRLRDAGPIVGPSQVIIHESVTSGGWRRVWDVLSRRHLGVHCIVQADGSVAQCVDLARRTVHAGSLNRTSIAIELATPYYPTEATRDRAVPAIWAHRGAYVLPTLEQCEATWLIVQALCTGRDWPPLAFPGVVAGHYLWGRVKGAEKAPGVQAHAATAHADGHFPCYFALMRYRGWSPERAWRATVDAASSGLRTTPLPAPEAVG